MCASHNVAMKRREYYFEMRDKKQNKMKGDFFSFLTNENAGIDEEKGRETIKL